ncbi:hypothetical protein ABFS83_07G093500 [Erythranthe nasuta]
METSEAAPSNFHIKIESFSFSLVEKSGIEKFETKEFVAGDHKWRLIIYPNGDNIIGKDRDYVCVYLAMADTSSLSANSEVNVVFSIFLFNQISGNYLCSLVEIEGAGRAKWITAHVLDDPEIPANK